ncbi:DUF4376 domain-containing protein [Oxalobacter paraformigenes]|uniref:DUF4376 domain-containing protein n=1 Tax=Oxalobacter paraformigenes TaxID=556268 RepID=C3X1Y1_9BURK|nr:DUF4376 domain-containing protein [Oxalobacter paraformigenes]EEO27217.1 hypothetical protein OFAG_00370 [Oxalobacter paraformigenes]
MIGKQITKPVSDWGDYTQTAIWCNDNRAVIEDKGDWYEVVALPEPPKPTLDEARAGKLVELNAAFATASANAHCRSSLGFEINADEIANRNIEGLTLVLQPGESTLFRAYDNTFHEVTREQLETMRKEIVVNSQKLYQAKWTLEAAITAAETVEALDTIALSAEALGELARGLKETTAGETDGQTE